MSLHNGKEARSFFSRARIKEKAWATKSGKISSLEGDEM